MLLQEMQADIAIQSVGVTKTEITSIYGDNRMYVYHQGSNALALEVVVILVDF